MSMRYTIFAVGALLAFADFKFHALSLVQCPVAFAFDSRPVDKDVVPGAVNGNEAVALFRVEPFDGSSCHDDHSFR